MITTIIPTYRRPVMLRRAVLSALAQENVDLQVCVYDNASGDETKEVVAELARQDPRVSYYSHQRNIGGMANFQFGLKSVATPFFSFLSDDDILLPGFYEKAITELGTFPDAAFWCGVSALITPEGVLHETRGNDWPREGLYLPPEGLLQIIEARMLMWTGALFRKSVMDKVGPLNERLEGPADFEYLFRATTHHPIVMSKHPSAIFLLNPNSFSETAPFEAFWPGWKDMIESVSSDHVLSKEVSKQVRAGLENNAKRMLFQTGAAALAKGHHDYSDKASEALDGEFGDTQRAALLFRLGQLCAKSDGSQRFYSWAYRQGKNLLAKSHLRQQRTYGKLARYL